MRCFQENLVHGGERQTDDRDEGEFIGPPVGVGAKIL